MNHRSKNRASRSAFGASSKRKADCRGRRVGGFAGSCFIRTGLAIAASAALPLSGTAAEAEPAEAAVDSAAAPASLPPFLFEPFYADNRGSVYGVYEARHADLVLVRGGFDTGLRDGMIC